MPSKKRATPISLQPLDALFGTNEETNNGICEIEIGSLHPFPNHPFQVKDGQQKKNEPSHDQKGVKAYRAKSRFARFYNIPELMNMFKEIADIKTSDQLKLPVPEAEYETVVLKPTEQQKEIVESLGERAEVVRNGGVDAAVDNMLKITNDGRKLAFGKGGGTGRGEL